MEEVTVVHNLDLLDNSFKAHLWEKTDTINEAHYSGSGYTGNKAQYPNFSPQNPNRVNAENIGIHMHGKSVNSGPVTPTTPIGFIPINAPSNPSNSNQFQEAAQANPNAHTSTLNSLSRDGHELIKATKKMAHGLGWTEARTRSVWLRQNQQVRVKEVFLQLMIILNYLATRNRF